MKDLSSAYWFNVGDNVQVTSSVTKAGIDLKGRVGEVIQTWEKCEVDPTCCCAEFVDDNFAVTVKFQGTCRLEPTTGTGSEDGFIKGVDTFTHYFNEEELLKVNDRKDEDTHTKKDTSDELSSVAFDGLSCKAFKLDQLKMGQQAQRIAAYEASQSQD